MTPYATSSALSQRITIEAKANRTSQFGGMLWEPLFTLWAGVKSRLGNETLISSQNKRVSTSRTTFTLRRSAQAESITPAMRALWCGAPYEILSVMETDDRNFILLEAERRY